jgi:hypothetical protein
MLSGMGILFGIGIDIQPHSVTAMTARIRIRMIKARTGLFSNFVGSPLYLYYEAPYKGFGEAFPAVL